MKTNKVRKVLNLFNIKGMAMLEFMITLFFAFLLVGVFIEGGYVLKSEAVLIAVTKNAAREITYTGKFDATLHNKIKSELEKRNLTLKSIQVQVEGEPLRTATDHETFMFRQDFAIVVTAEHPLRAVNLGKIQVLKIPLLAYVVSRIEFFDSNIQENYNPNTVNNSSD